MKDKNYEFIIIGGGIAGAIAAYICSKLNKKVIWFSSDNNALEGAIQVPPNSIKSLKKIGCFEGLKNYLNPISFIRVRDQNIRQDLSTISVDRKYYTLERKVLFSVLKNQIIKKSNILIINEKVISIGDLGKKCKCITSNGKEYISKFILGADGFSGITRNSLINKRENNIQSKHIYRAIIKKENHNQILFQSSINLWLDDGWHIVYYPFSNGKLLNLILVGKNSIKNLENSGNFELSLIKKINWQRIEYENIIHKTIFNFGKIFLLGDAAHPIQPHLAQGAAQTFYDGSILLENLSKNYDTLSSLQDYAKNRFKDIREVKDMSFFTGKVFELKGIKARIRNKLILGGNNYIQKFMYNIWE